MRKISGSSVAVLIAVLTQASAGTALAAGSDPITQDQFKAWTDWTKKSVDILDRREKKLEKSDKAQSSQTGEQPIDLNAPALGTSQTSLSESGSSSKSKIPHFEAYFDLNLVNQPGTQDSLAFDTYHNFLFVDLAPAPDVTFSFNLLGPSVAPIYYELDYQASKRLTLRAGKIWIPFDDLSAVSPHTIFGGRDGISQLMPTTTGSGGDIFLPTVWTELGVGAKYLLVDTSTLQLETHLCIVNGFTDGGQNPDGSTNPYPKFNEYSPQGAYALGAASGNHRNKSVDMRAHALFSNSFGIGVSYYTGQWNQDSDLTGHHGISLFGTDAQLRLGNVEFRLGFASMNVGLDDGNTHRGGSYFELGVPLSPMWTVRARGGTLQLDSRITLPTDMTIIGGTLLYNPAGNIQASLESNRDIKDPGVQVGFKSYTDLRLIMLF